MGSLAFFTQFLSLFGIANSLNVFIWMFGMGTLGGLVTAVSAILAYYGYDQAYQTSVDSNATSAETTAAESLILDLKMEMVFNGVLGIGIQVAMSYFATAWWSAQQKGMSDKKGGKEDWGDKDGDWDEDDWGDKDGGDWEGDKGDEGGKDGWESFIKLTDSFISLYAM